MNSAEAYRYWLAGALMGAGSAILLLIVGGYV